MTIIHQSQGRGGGYSLQWLIRGSKRGTFLRLLVFERVGISLAEVYERVGKSVILVDKRLKRANTCVL